MDEPKIGEEEVKPTSKVTLALIAAVAILGGMVNSYAAKYYVNGSALYYGTQLGTSSSDPWGGAIGMQRFLDTAAVGDTCYYKGNADTRRTKLINYVTLRGTWARGDTVNNLTRDGVGIIYRDSASKKITIDAQSGSFVNADSIINQPNTAGAKISGTPTMPGINVQKLNGAITTPMCIFGVNGSWVEDGTLDTIDGNDAARTMSCGLTVASAVNYYWIRNIVFRRAPTSCSGLHVISGTTAQLWCVNNCRFEYNAQDGITTLSYSSVDQSLFRNNGRAGHYGARYAEWSNCLFYKNTSNGIALGSVTVNDCVFASTGTGITSVDVMHINSCVFDSCPKAIDHSTASPVSVIKCKFTNCATTPITDYNGIVRDNIYINCGANVLTTMTLGTNPTTGTEGYTSKSTLDFSPAATATGRRVRSNIGQK